MLEDSFKVSEIRNKEIGIEFKYLAYQTGGKEIWKRSAVKQTPQKENTPPVPDCRKYGSYKIANNHFLEITILFERII